MGLLAKISRHSYKINLASLFLFTVFLNEYLVYYQNYSRYWPSVDSKSKRTVLLVADPQIQGLNDEWPSLLGSITRWDSDRYLATSFRWLLWAYKPSVIIFLGDLIDEGSTTMDPTVYNDYVDRFYSIYPRESAAKTIYLPGDNDVGGEGFDPFTQEKVERFKENFNGCGAFFQVNKRLQVFTYDPVKDTFPFVNKKDSKVRIFAAHRPIATLLSPREYFSRFPGRPSVIFSAHHHKGLIYKHHLQGEDPPEPIAHFSKKAWNGSALRWHMNDNKDVIYEINVPTCSYRMGVKEMAFGLFTFHKKMGYFEYTNLWLPERFPALARYLFAMILAGLYVIYHKLRVSSGMNTGRFYSNIKYAPLGR
uniref:Metallophosphoesterase 1 n=1 Tax=Caligus clemensi TaxID=344056 RepID=C1C1V9_CALCM|nr:Metallophosphoesterase 1 [Caligus clemensi]